MRARLVLALVGLVIPFPRTYDLKITGAPGDHVGTSVTSVGDVNGDGRGDVLVGTSRLRAYVVYGTPDRTPIDVSNLTPAQGFAISGILPRVSGVGDFNGDGYGDMVVGDPTAKPKDRTAAGRAWVLFGRAVSPAIDLANPLPAGAGIQIDGARRYEQAGRSINGAGDINGDGYDDVIIGAPAAGGYALINAGAAYVVYGSAAPVDLDLRALKPAAGFRMMGEDTGDGFGASVSTAGDVNHDGLADMIIGAPGADNTGTYRSGSSFVVLGAKVHTDFPFSKLTPDRGFRFDGRGCFQRSGASVGWLGDINGDGFDDVVVGAPDWCKPFAYAGAAYILPGGPVRRSVRITGLAQEAHLGEVVSGAGDLDGDHLNDMLLRSVGTGSSGVNLVVYGAMGRLAAPRVELLDAGRGGQLSGANDFDGDGRNDLIVGSPRGNAAYIITRASPDTAPSPPPR